jgi:hypothetical protein
VARDLRFIMNGYSLNRDMACGGDAFGGNAMIEDGVIMRSDRRKGSALFIDMRGLVVKHSMAAQVVVAQIAEWNEGETIRCDMKIGKGFGRPSVECKSNADGEASRGRQRGPTAVIRSVSPADP